MKRSLFNKWIAELKNPKTKQTISCLRSPYGGMCCLGVLLNCINPEWKKDRNGSADLAWGIEHETMMLPGLTAERLGMEPNGGAVDGVWGILPLTKLNDMGTSFPEIAQILETRSELYISNIEEDL